MIEQYDNQAKEYANEENKIVKKYVFTPSFFENLGEVKGKKVLDLACGDGYLTRKIKERGAKEVIGVDISSEMIKLALEEEKENPLGITYLVEDVAKLGKLGEFDIITAGMLLHYSKTKEELFKMCESIYKNLKKGGRFVSLNHNIFHPINLIKKYGITIEGNIPLKEGQELKLNFYENEKQVCSFIFYYWKKETYEEALIKAGLKNIEWIPVTISKEGINKFGEEFWKEFNPTCIILEAKK